MNDDVFRSYAERHESATNLVLHALLVPVFIAGTAAVVAAAVRLDGSLAAAGTAAMLLSIALQGRGHARERVPFVARGPGHFLRAIFVEQLVTFPRFVLSGAFARALRAARRLDSGRSTLGR